MNASPRGAAARSGRVRAALVFNPAAGSAGTEPIDELRSRLERSFDVSIYETADDRDPGACARAALAAGAALVIAAGGDGTVSSVAEVLVGGEVPLGIIPRGTANSLAAALGIPDDTEGACGNLERAHRRVLDTARCGDRFMVLHCSIGLHAEAIGDTPTDSKKRWGTLAYLATGLRKMTGIEPFDVELETEAHVIRCQASSVTVANLAPPRTVVAQGPSRIAGDDGLLDVTVLAPTSLAGAVAMGVHLFRTARMEEAATADDIGYFACGSLTIRATPPQQVAIDGEVVGQTPIAIRCVPGSLLVLAPPATAEREGPEARLDALPAIEIEPKRQDRSDDAARRGRRT